MADITSATYYNDWKTVLIPRLRETEAWSDLFDSISEVFANNIYKYVELLHYIRDPSKQDKMTNIMQAEFLGFKYNSDKFTDEEYANIVYFLNYYNRKVKGTYDFINFLGWVKNAKFKLVQLWAQGEYNYSDDPTVKDPFQEEGWVTSRNSLVDGTGNQKWYPTSHVDMTYNGEDFHIDESDVWYLFYKCAPIHLVLRAIAAVITADPYYLNFNLATNNHTNTHWCIPCIYYNPAKLYMAADEGAATSTYHCQESVYGLRRGVGVTYYPLWSFDKNYIASELKSSFTFTRDSEATNIERGWYRYKIVEANYPRFSYYPETSASHWKGKGLLIEKTSTNFLLNSSTPVTRQINLDSGDYTFSGKGKYRLSNINTSQQIAIVDSSSYTFHLDTSSSILITVLDQAQFPWYQLERGTEATSLIVTGANKSAIRGADILKCLNLPTIDKSGSFIIQVSDISEKCMILKVYESSTKYLEIRRNGDKIIASTRNGFSNPNLEIDFAETLNISISPSKLIINSKVLPFPTDNNIIPKYCYIGQDEGREAINGYVTKFFYVPHYIEQI